MLQFISITQAQAILKNLQKDDPEATLHPKYNGKHMGEETCIGYETTQPASLGKALMGAARAGGWFAKADDILVLINHEKQENGKTMAYFHGLKLSPV